MSDRERRMHVALLNANCARIEGRSFYGFGNWLWLGLVSRQMRLRRPLPRLMGMEP